MSDNFDKFAILESFLDEVSSYLPEIEENLDALQQRPDDMNVIEETYRRAHTIGGSAAMMDYGNLAHVAQGVEDILGHAIDSQTALNAPTIALLRRSFSRLSRLVEYIRSNTDGSILVTEDDADRAAWRGSSATGTSDPFGASSGRNNSGVLPLGDVRQPMDVGQGSSPGMAVPDWLAPFAASGDLPSAGTSSGQTPLSPVPSTPIQPASPKPGMNGPIVDPADTPTGPIPAIAPGQLGSGAGDPPFQPSMERPVDPWATSISGYPTGQVPNLPPTPPYSSEPRDSYEEILSAFTTSSLADEAGRHDLRSDMPTAPRIPVVQPPNNVSRPLQQHPSSPGVDFSMLGTNQMPSMPAAGGFNDVPQAQGRNDMPLEMKMDSPLDDLLLNEETVHRQVTTLRDVAASIYNAANAMEDERTELRGFLDGSRDALSRLEEWAGRQMGLDLQRSPDSVRRYLPLSVIWVTTMRLKKLIALLNNAGRGLTATEEQIEETLADLHTSMSSLGQMFRGAASVGGAPGNGFSATVAQFSWTPPGADPRVSERSTASLPEIPVLTAGTRAELERDVREQLRRELEDEVRAEIAAEVRRDEEDHLRQELQIQVRRQLLSELTPSVPGAAGNMPSLLSSIPMGTTHSPRPVQVTSEQSAEAMEVFREEAQEHLQSITSGIAELESAPLDTAVLQNIRRAMHTLKGAAGMMGFVVIQQMAHASEDLLDRLVEQTLSLTSEVLSLLLDTSEALDFMITKALGYPSEQQKALQSLASRYVQMTGIQIAPEILGDSPATQRITDPVMVGLEEEGEEGAPQTGSDNAGLSVRLQLSKLDDLVNLFGELLINRSVLEERVDRLNRLANDGSMVSERLRDVSAQIDTGFEAAALPSGPGSVSGNISTITTMTNLSAAPDQSNRSGWAPAGGGRSSQGFHELELDRYTEFHQLTRGLGEGVADIITLTHEMVSVLRECQASFARESRLSSDFQERLLKARLVPLQSLVPRLYRTARASALREGKEIKFFADGADTEVDRKVFEEVVGPLLHLVRNAVNHGIERPEERELAGKPPVGQIIVSAAYEGNQVVISVRDDGAGIDPEHIRNTAVTRGWIDSYSQLSEREAINLIFQPGITTAESLTEESGRGVGLDVVRDTVTRLRGTIEVESAVGQGTVFTMKLPISLQIARAVLVKVKNQTLAIPMAVVDQIGRLDYYQTVALPVPAIELRGERYPLAHLASYLRLQPDPAQERSSVLLVNAGNRRIALLVDSVLVQQEIVAKPLGPHLRDVRGVAGASVLGNGQVVVILELHELLAQQPPDPVVLPSRTEGGSARLDAYAPSDEMERLAGYPAAPNRPPTPSTSLPQAGPPAATGPAPFVVSNQMPTVTSPHRVTVASSGTHSYVLVVDDSPSVRRVVSNMLKASNWDVQTARDGVEALELIARQEPAAVLLDIEMPRMDGYELMATLRSQEQYRHLPLIVLTSRAATKHHQRAFQLGADAYLVKPYQDEELLSTLARLTKPGN